MIEIAGALGIAELRRIADLEEEASVPRAVLDRLATAHDEARDLAEHAAVYGRSTGVGANKDTAVADDGDAHARRLLRSHAVDAGEVVPDRVVRAMLAVRLNQLAVGGSGVEPAVVAALAEMLRRDALPTVRTLGSIGTGDLTALAGTALTLLGERPASTPLEALDAWGSESALSFISSSALTIARAALAVTELRRLDRAWSAVCALSFHALDGNAQAYAEAAAGASAAPGVEAAAAAVRALIGPVPEPARIQDPFALRIAAITQGVVVTAADRLADQVEALIGAAQENPLYVFGVDDGSRAVLHHGAFFQAQLAAELDATALALAQASTVTFSRLRLLNEPAFTGLPPFLGDGEPGASGLMMVEYVAAGAVADIRHAAQPAALGTVVLSRGAEEDAPFAAQAVAQLEDAVVATRTLIGCELLGAVRVVRRLGVADRLTGVLAEVFARASASLGSDDADRDLRPDLERATALLAEIADLVEGG
ncbi:aromatic amino acid lyase [Plantibacter sp. MCCC 1A11337]|uniref:aromatic amino acid lyase n=1 Tax=Plantibacter sp. MCCC 1A11337 TaxID=2736644 RepID=UPI0015836C15|nr:aromatic amino acid lyase [Plantibacter sp. MCCC 1A11337]NUJ89761.1 aromatic amino acid lyase [Plantibacter sp. MCCC 1A11337]